MNNKKRAIMVPVMTLAVCAIAIVGLGFAINTSVTSNSNTVEKLMIDLDSDYKDLFDQKEPDDDQVNGLFSISMESDKKTLSGNTTTSGSDTSFTASFGSPYGNVTTTLTTGSPGTYSITVDGQAATNIAGSTTDGTTTITGTYGSNSYKTVISNGKATTTATAVTISGGSAFIKVFGNKDMTSLTITNTSNISAVFTLYTVTYETNKITSITNTSNTATFSNANSASFSTTPSTNTTYLVAITQIGAGYNINYNVNSAGKIVPTLSGTLDLESVLSYDLTFIAEA